MHTIATAAGVSKQPNLRPSGYSSALRRRLFDANNAKAQDSRGASAGGANGDAAVRMDVADWEGSGEVAPRPRSEPSGGVADVTELSVACQSAAVGERERKSTTARTITLMRHFEWPKSSLRRHTPRHLASSTPVPAHSVARSIAGSDKRSWCCRGCVHSCCMRGG